MNTKYNYDNAELKITSARIAIYHLNVRVYTDAGEIYRMCFKREHVHGRFTIPAIIIEYLSRL